MSQAHSAAQFSCTGAEIIRHVSVYVHVMSFNLQVKQTLALALGLRNKEAGQAGATQSCSRFRNFKSLLSLNA